MRPTDRMTTVCAPYAADARALAMHKPACTRATAAQYCHKHSVSRKGVSICAANERRSGLLTASHQRRFATLCVSPKVSQTETLVADDVPRSLPRTPVDMVRQASQAVTRGLADGKKRQMLELLLPVNEKEYDFLATEACDYPCSLQKEFETAVSLVKAIVRNAAGGEAVQVNVQRIDEGGVEGEPCAIVFTEAKDFAAIVFPTAERLKDIRSLAAKENRPLLIVNAQWRESGQIVSDFGFGPWRKAAMDFLDTFQASYGMYEQRIGAPGSINAATGERFVTGGVVRILNSYPAGFQVFAMAADGSSQLLSEFDHKPTYKELEALLADARKAKLDIFKIAKVVTNVYAEPVDRTVDSDVMDAPSTDDLQAVISADEIDALDAVTLRRYLSSMNLPTSGKMSKLRERLREAMNYPKK